MSTRRPAFATVLIAAGVVVFVVLVFYHCRDFHDRRLIRDPRRRRTDNNPAQYVQPFMGTEAGGNMFPGVTHPFGVVKLGPDLAPPPNAGDPYSGYHVHGNITGFSMMHESGTGGSPKYGVVSQLPIVGTVQNPLLDYAQPRAGKDEAMVGWYRSSLANGVSVELAAGEHVGMLRHTFPSGGGDKHILVDVSHFLPSFRGLGFEQHYVGGALKLHSNGTYTGWGRYNGGWNYGVDWDIFFCGRFDTSFRGRAFEGVGETLETFGVKEEVEGLDKRVGALFTFAHRDPSRELVVESRVGISWLSEGRACEFVEQEIPRGRDVFQYLVDTAVGKWNEVLGKVTTSETNEGMLQLFYTSIYGMFLIPSDRTGENPLWSSTEPYFDDIFTLWDTFRSHTPLFHILLPNIYTRFIRSLLDTWRHTGFLPDARSSNYNGRVQGGSNADNVLADAFAKKLQGIDWFTVYRALLADAEVTPENNNDPQAPDSSTKEGRGALPDWKEKGYITTDYTRSVSRAIEYAYNDFCISQVAAGLEEAEDAETYRNRSRQWRNHWDDRMEVYNHTGFLSPIHPNGSFPTPPQDPLSCGGCYWGDDYYQALPYEYTFNAIHDMKTLISLSGGDSKFVERLDKMFEPNSFPKGNGGFNHTIFNPGNEPSFAAPYLFNFVPGQQWHSVQRSREIARNYYHPGVNGLPGNSDAGAMQSWVLWTFIGLYPIAGTTTFLIGAPRQQRLEIDLGGGKRFIVTAEGGDEDAGAWFVQSLRVNGEVWNKSWVEWADVFEYGGRMEFVLGAEKTAWDAQGGRPLWGLV